MSEALSMFLAFLGAVALVAFGLGVIAGGPFTVVSLQSARQEILPSYVVLNRLTGSAWECLRFNCVEVTYPAKARR